MGQKTNPKAFRLVTNQYHLSKWYVKNFAYSQLIQEDFLIRKTINELFAKFLILSNIEINRITNTNNQDYTNILIYALYPRTKDILKEVTNFISKNFNTPNNIVLNNSKEYLKISTTFLLKNLSRSLLRYLSLKFEKNYFLTIKFIRNPFNNATLIAKHIAEQLERRIPFRRAIKQTIKKVQYTDVKGIKIQVSGRLNGIEIARSEWKKEGQIPLHTLDAKIDYIHYPAQTIYGLIGIKVWLFSE